MGKDCHRFDGHGGDCGGGISSSKLKRKANGCLTAFYHLFDFPHFYSPSHHHLTIDSTSRSKGLKLTEESLTSTTYKEKQSLKSPVSHNLKWRTDTGATSSRLRAIVTDTSTSSSELCNSPGSKTPNLVARLMGLDLLPDQTDSLPNLHTSHVLSKKAKRLGTRSLPESPRISSARKSDFDTHRLSLQLNKENNRLEELRCSRLKEMKQDLEETRSPRDHARQIVKQIKERVVTRRVVCRDITNSANREAGPSQNRNELRRDSTVSCSPRTNSTSSFRPEQKPKPATVILVTVAKASEEKQSLRRVKQRQLRPINRCKKAESETRRPIKPSPTPDTRSKQREALHKKKLKKLPKSNDLHNIISATGPPHKQIDGPEVLKWNEEASICLNLMHETEKNCPQVARSNKPEDAANASSSYEGIGIEKDYIFKIMNLAGINSDSLVSSASNSLDPSIFTKLEHLEENPSGSLALRCNRKLLFDQLNEILTEAAKRSGNCHRSELINELCSAVGGYGRKRFPVPEDITSMDFNQILETKKKVEEAGEETVAEIERDIIDELVLETVFELSLKHDTISKRQPLNEI